MRLTPDHVSQADQGLNCLGDRELVLRGMGIPVIENLAVARDGFDVIDLSANVVSVLGDGFPPFPRLSSLYLGSNRIAKITAGLADSLPNLKVLILTSNRLNNLDDLNVKEISRLSKLEVLSVLDNPVAGVSGLRQLLVENIPSLKVLNFAKVSLAERQEASRNRDMSNGNAGKRKRESQNGRRAKRSRSAVGERVKTFEVGGLGEDLQARKPATAKAPMLSEEQSTKVKKLIEEAETTEQVVGIQMAIRNGTIAEMLAKLNADLRSVSANAE